MSALALVPGAACSDTPEPEVHTARSNVSVDPRRVNLTLPLRVQISIASEGGSGTSVPDLSIEVDDVDAVYQRAKSLGHAIEYELTVEPWGVRRFCLFDPTGKLLNILSHTR